MYRFFAWLFGIMFAFTFVMLNLIANQRDEARLMARPQIMTGNGVITLQCEPRGKPQL
ncbi:hypothetical protein [Pseudomonas sp. USHLN015]|uniref:hypothetical protein n=1 Tax=Pseudomonas sp. USHLN015 TaxID=3081296 RepID=UPI00301D2D36